MNNIKIDTVDLIIIIAYIVGILFIGLWSVRKSKMTSDNYFLAGRGLKWLIVGAALFASNISTIHMVGLAASGYNDGLVWGNFEWMAVFTLILLGLIFAPFYIKDQDCNPSGIPGKAIRACIQDFPCIYGNTCCIVYSHGDESLCRGCCVRIFLRDQCDSLDYNYFGCNDSLYGYWGIKSRNGYRVCADNNSHCRRYTCYDLWNTGPA